MLKNIVFFQNKLAKKCKFTNTTLMDQTRETIARSPWLSSEAVHCISTTLDKRVEVSRLVLCA